MIPGLQPLLRAATETIAPGACPACNRAAGPRYRALGAPGELLCDDCRLLLVPLHTEAMCQRCGIAPAEAGRNAGRCLDCDPLPATFVQARAAWPYAGPAGAIVRAIKYRNSPFLAEWFMELSMERQRPWLDAVAADAVVAAMPMHWWRELHRGYNQATELATALAARLQRPLVGEGVLLRHRARGPQARFHTRHERLANLSESFHVKREAPIAGRRILLVDDVMTTGATAAQAAGALLEGGAKEVYLFTAVRARLSEDAVEVGER